MKDNKLYKISLLISISGLIVLLAWASLIEPEKVGIDSITDGDVGSEVIVEGAVQDPSWSQDGHLFFHVKDRKGRILVVLFDSDAEEMGIDKNSLTAGERIEVTGEVQRHNDQLEIIPRRIEKIG